MATILNKENKLTEAQQKDIVIRCNEAYDRGVADALRFVMVSAKQVAIDNPLFEEYSAFVLYVAEAVRQRLAEAVNDHVHDSIPEKSPIVL
jgi:hypothetical protein